tara:strand:- start:13750 stop:14088 length:339 start_codon:yes stop_codon:yes gene_type:complete
MNADLSDFMKNMKKMQDNIQTAQGELVNKNIIGDAASGAVRVLLNGRFDVKRVKISPEMMKEPVNVLEEAIASAFNSAVKQIEDFSKQKMSGLMEGVQLPEGMADKGEDDSL